MGKWTARIKGTRMLHSGSHFLCHESSYSTTARIKGTQMLHSRSHFLCHKSSFSTTALLQSLVFVHAPYNIVTNLRSTIFLPWFANVWGGVDSVRRPPAHAFEMLKQCRVMSTLHAKRSASSLVNVLVRQVPFSSGVHSKFWGHKARWRRTMRGREGGKEGKGEEDLFTWETQIHLQFGSSPHSGHLSVSLRQ